MRSVKALGSIGLLGALLAAACGDSARSLNPTAPSSVVATDQSSEGGESGPTGGKPGDKGKPDGKGKPGDKGKPVGPKTPAPVPPTNGSPGSPVVPTNPVTGKVNLEGVISAKIGTSITVNGQSVVVPSTATIRHGSRSIAFSELKVGDRVHVKASMKGTVLEATEVKLQNPGDDEDDDEDDDRSAREVDVRGTVSLLNGVCPVISFTVGTAKVTTAAKTTFKGGNCVALKNGDRVEVEGSRQADGTVLAKDVKAVKTEPPVSEITGMVSLLSGTCPAMSFTVGTRRVTTAAATRFKGGACAALKNGKRVEVKGTPQSDGTLLATVVEID